MTDDLRMLDELEALEKRATPVPWSVVRSVTCGHLRAGHNMNTAEPAKEWTNHDINLIEDARNALPTLLRLARRAGEMEAFAEVFDAAFGLCCGYDWNHGSHAIMHGYRRKLLEAVNRIRPIPDFSGKIANLKEQGHD